MSKNNSIVPMRTAGIHHFVERTYRESGQFQWVRETIVNAIEADATRMEFGIEWQAVRNRGLYRRMISDNGKGMTAEELVSFFNTFGGGGKVIGGAHENFGVGSKTSLLPWNRYGLVVISWVSGTPSMIWVTQEKASGEYGLKVLETAEPASKIFSSHEVVRPFLDHEHGCDWRTVKPSWIGNNGTVIILLGNHPGQNTILGDPNREEQDIKGISKYINQRFWEIPSSFSLSIEELRTQNKENWPKPYSTDWQGLTQANDSRTNLRSIKGAKHFVEYSFGTGGLKEKGIVTLEDSTEIEWYLWNGERPEIHSYAAEKGFIAAIYKNELYDFNQHHSLYRAFGISEATVRNNVWLIVKPHTYSERAKKGVYPRTDRNALLMKSGTGAVLPLPMAEWGAQFSERMPEAIRNAILEARTGRSGTIDNPTWRKRLMDRFGFRWKVNKFRVVDSGEFLTSPAQGGPEVSKPSDDTNDENPRVRKKRKADQTPKGPKDIGNSGSTAKAKLVRMNGGLPHYRTVSKNEIELGMLAAWQPNDPEFPEGVILLNVDHPVLAEQIRFWQSQYPEHHAEAISADVIDVYGQVAVAKVAHSEHLKGLLPAETIDRDFRSNAALTMALLGLVSEEDSILARVSGKYGKRIASA